MNPGSRWFSTGTRCLPYAETWFEWLPMFMGSSRIGRHRIMLSRSVRRAESGIVRTGFSQQVLKDLVVADHVTGQGLIHFLHFGFLHPGRHSKTGRSQQDTVEEWSCHGLFFGIHAVPDRCGRSSSSNRRLYQNRRPVQGWPSRLEEAEVAYWTPRGR